LKPKNKLQHTSNSLSSGADNKIQVIKKEVVPKKAPIKVKKIGSSTMLLGKVIDL